MESRFHMTWQLFNIHLKSFQLDTSCLNTKRWSQVKEFDMILTSLEDLLAIALQQNFNRTFCGYFLISLKTLRHANVDTVQVKAELL